MRTAEQIEQAVFGGPAHTQYWYRDAFTRMSLLHLNIDAAEIIRFEGHRLTKVYGLAKANLETWAFGPNSAHNSQPELASFREALESLREMHKIVASPTAPGNEGSLLKESVWHFMQAIEKEHEKDKLALELDVHRDAHDLSGTEKQRLREALDHLTAAMLSEAEDRQNGRRDCLREFQDLAASREGRECPSVMLRLGWLYATVLRERNEASEALEKCVKASKGSTTVTNWMAHRLLAAMAAAEGDFAVADFWMMQGATMRKGAHALYEAGLYAGRNERNNEARLLFTRAIELHSLPILMVLADDDLTYCRDDMFDAICSAQLALKAEGRSLISQWGTTAALAEEAAAIAGVEAIASTSLLKDHHRFTASLPHADVVTAGYMGQRAVVSRKYLVDEVTLTLQREYTSRAEKVGEAEHALETEAALREVKLRQAHEAREVDINRARESHKKSASHYKSIEMGCSIAFAIGVAAIGTFLALAVICSVKGTSFGVESPVGLMVIVAGMVPVGLMLATHVVHGIFEVRATGELAALMRRAEREYQSRVAAIESEFEERMAILRADYQACRQDVERGRAGLAKFGAEPPDKGQLTPKAA